MKRLLISAALAATAGLALAGEASAKTPSLNDLLACLQLERQHPGVCAQGGTPDPVTDTGVIN